MEHDRNDHPEGGAGNEPVGRVDDQAGHREQRTADASTEPQHVSGTGKWSTVKRAVSEFRADQMTDQAAALTYYGVLSLFPGLLVLVAILGVFGDPQATTDAMTDIVAELAPGTAADTFTDAVQSITEQKGTAGVMLIVGVLGALWSASGYIGAFMRAANVAYETDEGRPFWKLRPLQLLLTLGAVLMAAIVLFSLVLTGPVVSAIADPVGLGDQAVDVWNIAKWPAMLLIVIVIFAILFYAAPNARIPKFQLVTPGAVVAIVLWILASVAFALYVANFGSYNKTYGTLGGAVSLLVWLWISNCAILLGLELNSEVERSREIRRGVPGARDELQLEHRDTPQADATAGSDHERRNATPVAEADAGKHGDRAAATGDEAHPSR